MSCVDKEKLKTMRDAVCRQLLAVRQQGGDWVGQLSASPLATAVSVYALSLVNADQFATPIEAGLDWLCDHQNADGGWGDTDGKDPSNISTTLLVRSALWAVRNDKLIYLDAYEKSDVWLVNYGCGLEPADIVKAVYDRYGKDRTFAVPILTMCVLSGMFDQADRPWRFVRPLPFELAVVPRRLFRWLNLSVVSYALPALIAIGQVKYHYDRPGNPIVRTLRGFSRKKTLDLLKAIQPDNGGFLEAVPLTAFVTMALGACGQKDHPVVQKGVAFLLKSARPDGSWPIDSNLSTWVTTLSVNALAGGHKPLYSFNEREKASLVEWLLAQQYKSRHVYTNAAPGGWGWTNLPGAVPDADDTAGALTALHCLAAGNRRVIQAAQQGVRWLLDLQNTDGGIPTFCRGWGKLEFDRSGPDLTAHAVMAWQRWRLSLDAAMQKRIDKATDKALNYLAQKQCSTGSWLPLWFGNPLAENKKNFVYGTSCVLSALAQIDTNLLEQYRAMIQNATDWLVTEQNADGSWAAQKTMPGSIEETASAVRALLRINKIWSAEDTSITDAAQNGVQWLMDQTHYGQLFEPAAIGLYFANLWYYEQRYPLIFTAGALGELS